MKIGPCWMFSIADECFNCFLSGTFHFSFFYVSFTFQFSFFYISLAFRFNSVLPHFSRLHVSESSSVNHLKRRCFTIEMKIVNESKDCSDLLFIDKFRLFETSLVLCLPMLAENEIPSV
jgi:hypothetical protein